MEPKADLSLPRADQPYADSVEHLSDELWRLDLLLRRALWLVRPAGTGTPPSEVPAEVPADSADWRGLLISEAEIDQLLATQSFLLAPWQQALAQADQLRPLEAQLETLRQHIDRRRALSAAQQIPLALPRLAARFALSPAEVDVLLVALAPELEPRYETLYAYLHNDVTRKRPSVELALHLICRTPREKLAARQLVAPEAALLRHRLLELGKETHEPRPSFLRQTLQVDETVVRFLLDQPPSVRGLGELYPALAPGLARPGQARPELARFGPETSARLAHLAETLAAHSSAGAGVTVRLIGDLEAGTRAAAQNLAARLGRPLLEIELADLGADGERLALLRRNASLWPALLAITCSEAPAGLEESALKANEAALWRGLSDLDEAVLLLGPADCFARIPPRARVLRLEIEPPDLAVREQLWQETLNGGRHTIDVARLADSFHFGAERIAQTCALAQGLAALRGPAATASTDDLLAAGRALTRPNVSRFALRLEPCYRWSDIVLPAAKLDQLKSIATRLRYRRVVHGDWGFGAKLSRGKGTNVLFTGPSGTGKTMAAEILAGELGFDLYQIDLSTVVSKYIGETEKHLNAIFKEAEHSPSLLFFDEADALFGKRTEVKDAHDRYANIEVNYLLQRIEQFTGVVILATNLQRNLDDAFLRRMQDVVEFPLPDETSRARIWEGHLPAQAPRDPAIDFAFLGRQFKLSGGNIKNIVLHAAYLAAEGACPIGMQQLILATRAEYVKQGKLCVKSDFGPYYELLHG